MDRTERDKMNIQDPRPLFDSVFKRTYEPCRDFSGTETPWTLGQLPPGDLFEGGDEEWRESFVKLMCCYVSHRLDDAPEQLDEDECGRMRRMVQSEICWTDIWIHLPGCLNMLLRRIPRDAEEGIFSILLNTHLTCMRDRQTCFRPEFALLASFQGSFSWASPYKEMYWKVRHGFEELEELYHFAPVHEFLTIFFGEKRKWPTSDMTTYSWDLCGPVDEPDTSSCLGVGGSFHFPGKRRLDWISSRDNQEMRDDLGKLLGIEP